MKNHLKLLLLLLTTQVYCQVVFDKYPIVNSANNIIKTNELLDKIQWNKLKENSKKSDIHHVYEYHNEFTDEYSYSLQGNDSYFKITSLNNEVISFNSRTQTNNYNNNTNYFNNIIWLKYVEKVLPNLNSKYKLTNEYQEDILVNYYKILGVDSRNEYGWICEYSTVGKATEKRKATIQLIKYNRIDLLKNLLNYPDYQVQIYALEALIYIDYIYRLEIENSKLKNDLSSKNYIEYCNEYLLDDFSKNKLYTLKEKNPQIISCGNNGSYKIYETNALEILSEKNIEDIPKNFEFLKKIGYFHD